MRLWIKMDSFQIIKFFNIIKLKLHTDTTVNLMDSWFQDYRSNCPLQNDRRNTLEHLYVRSATSHLNLMQTLPIVNILKRLCFTYTNRKNRTCILLNVWACGYIRWGGKRNCRGRKVAWMDQWKRWSVSALMLSGLLNCQTCLHD